MEVPDDANLQGLTRKLQRLERRREHVFDQFFGAFLGDRHKIEFFNDSLLSECVKIILRVLNGTNVYSHMYSKACYCLSLICSVHTNGALCIVKNGGIAAILEAMKAFPRDETLQAGFLITLSDMSSKSTDKEPFVDVVERVVAAMERLPWASEVYEAACLFVMAVSPKFDFNPFEYELLVGNIVNGFDIHGHDDRAHFTGRKAIECLVADPVLAGYIVSEAALKQNPGAAA